MYVRHRELLLLLSGDFAFFHLALWLTLTVRYLEVPSKEVVELHFLPFLILSFIWIGVYYVAGLYDKHTVFLKGRLLELIVNTQIFNILLAAVFFFLVPFFSIAPKTNLLIYLLISSLLIALWRLVLFGKIRTEKKYKALLMADGEEAEELLHEVNENSRYEYDFVRHVDLKLVEGTPDFAAKALDVIRRENISIVVAEAYNPHLAVLMPALYDLSFHEARLTFVDFHTAYEEIFDRVSLSSMRYEWFLHHLSTSRKGIYDLLKRVMDIVGGFALSLLFLMLYPVIALLIKLEDRGPILIRQKRLGKYGVPIHIYKFRTMAENDQGAWKGESKNRITTVGAVLRKTSIDEFPQAWSVLKGDMSLIGPRNDIQSLGARLSQEIPYYNVRYSITPGISGWAQTHQHYAASNISPQSVEESRIRLAYDLYYIKNRSLWLDLSIALRTMKALLSRFGPSVRLRYNETHD